MQPLRQSPSYEYRLGKYAERYGLSIYVPGLHPLVFRDFKAQLGAQLELLLESVLTDHPIYGGTVVDGR